MPSPRQVAHDVGGGVRLATEGQRRVFSVHCRCGWRSESCSTPMHAEAAGEQHLQLFVRQGRRLEP